MAAGRWQLDSPPPPPPPANRRGRWQLDKMSGSDAFFSGLGNGLSFGWGDELMGLGAGAGAALQGQDFQRAMDEQVARSRANYAQAERDQPFATGAGDLTGAIGSTLLPGGAIGAGLKGAGLAARLGIAAGVGAGMGALQGAGEGRTTEERLQGAAAGGAVGAAFGGGAHALLGEAIPAATGAARRYIAANTGILATPGRSGRAEMALQDLMSTARQNPGLNIRSPQDLAAAANAAAARDPTLTTAEILGASGQGRLAALARAPGQTGQAVEDFFEARARNQPDEVTSAVLGRAPTSGDALEQQLREAWRTQGRQLYRPLLSQPLTAQEGAAFERLKASPLWSHRAVQSAWNRAGSMIADDVALGNLPAEAASSIKTRLHYTKVALSDMVDNPATLEPGLANINNANLSQTAHTFANELNSVIPGYNTARATLADIGASRRAVETGRQAFSRREFATPAALSRHVSALDPKVRPFFLAGVEDELGNRIMQAGRDGRRNIANALLGDATQARMRAIYGADAEPMIQRLRDISAKFDFGQRVLPSKGSITSNVLLQLAPGVAAGAGLGAANAKDDPLLGALTGGALGFGVQAAARRMFSRELVQLMERNAERQRDTLGKLYMTPVSEYPQQVGGLISAAERQARMRAYKMRLGRTRGALWQGLGAGGLAPNPAEQQQ